MLYSLTQILQCDGERVFVFVVQPKDVFTNIKGFCVCVCRNQEELHTKKRKMHLTVKTGHLPVYPSDSTDWLESTHQMVGSG